MNLNILILHRWGQRVCLTLWGVTDQSKGYLFKNNYSIYAPMIYTAPCIMLLMRADTLRGEVVGGLALEISSFVGPCEMARADRRVPLEAHVMYLHASKALRTGPNKSLVHRWFYEHVNALIKFWCPSWLSFLFNFVIFCLHYWYIIHPWWLADRPAAALVKICSVSFLHLDFPGMNQGTNCIAGPTLLERELVKQVGGGEGMGVGPNL
jgi:hypothetical protein